MIFAFFILRFLLYLHESMRKCYVVTFLQHEYLGEVDI